MNLQQRILWTGLGLLGLTLVTVVHLLCKTGTWRELAARWYCWRHNVIRLAKVIRVHSIRVGNVEQLEGKLPGDAFTSVTLRKFAETGWGIAIDVENAGAEPVAFMASVFFRAVATDRLESLSFAPTVLAANEKRTFVTSFPCVAEILSLEIPRYTPRPLVLP